ncbi:hypothetical protein LOTGIDRAFT_158423 [Lottia gigantea]|uniref:Uncharacterized protein n=1 Tax=Lottia gigantea TaxID=225164 RepID=V4AQ66_LOTGI|nr:hypothetical protein LOTGIDRAFT_158423 [Lottia gigantea]ESO99337.1 hypothetical protein LOTGIDRAFT_158423 [Lottia gigantea]
MANKFGLDSLHLDTKKSNTTAWINIAKLYFVEQIGDTLQEQLLNVVDKTQLQPLSSLISNLDDKITKQKIDLKQLIANINPGISEDKLTTLESKLIDNSEIQKQIVGIKQQLLNVVDKTQLENLKSFISKLDDKITKQKIDLKQLIDNIKPGISEDTWQKESTALETKFKTELQKELTNIKQQIENILIIVKVDSIFFTQKSETSNQFNAHKVLQFINGRENVEAKEFEINDENTKVFPHLYEIKTNGKYIDRFRMLILPDNEDEVFGLGKFHMMLETETPPSKFAPHNCKRGIRLGFIFTQLTFLSYKKKKSLVIKEIEDNYEQVWKTCRDDNAVTQVSPLKLNVFSSISDAGLFAWDCKTYSESETRKAIPYACTLINLEKLRKMLDRTNNLFPDLMNVPEEFYDKLMKIVEIFVGTDCIDQMLKYLRQYDRKRLILISHNGSNFDNWIVLKNVKKLTQCPLKTPRGIISLPLSNPYTDEDLQKK